MKMKNKQKGVVLLSALVFLIVLLTFLRFSLGSAKLSELKAGADYDDLLAREAAFMTLKNAEDEINKKSILTPGNGYYELKDGVKVLSKSNLNWRSLDCGGSGNFICFDGQNNLGNGFSDGKMVGKYIVEYKGDLIMVTAVGHSAYKYGVSNITIGNNGNSNDFTNVVLRAFYRRESSVTNFWGSQIHVFNGNQAQSAFGNIDNNNQRIVEAKLYACNISKSNGDIIVANIKTENSNSIVGGTGDYINPAFCDPNLSTYNNGLNQYKDQIVPYNKIQTSSTANNGKLIRVGLREINGF